MTALRVLPSDRSEGGALVTLRSQTGVALVAATVLASMVGFLDAYVVNVAVPAIGRDLRASVASLQWALTGYLGAVGVVGLAALVPVERGLRAPMLGLSLFGSRQFDAINATTVLYYGALSAASYLFILQCQPQLGYSASQAGAALIPQAAVFLIISPLSGALVSRVGPRWLMVSGILTTAAAFLWLSRAHAGAGYGEAILPAALLWGLGLGLAVTPLTAAVLAAVTDSDLGEASAINDAASRLGAVVAIAVVPVLIGASGGRSLADALSDGYQPAMIAPGGLCVAAALVTALSVADDRVSAPRIAPPAPHHGCAIPVPELEER